MTTISSFAEIAALAGDPARANMLQALMDGRALTATELARVSGTAPQTTSGHLKRLPQAGLLAVAQQGRHRYHRLASAEVARMVESIMQVAAAGVVPRRPIVTGPRDTALRAAWTCYDHLAGRLGVALADALVAAGHVELSEDGGVVTDSGRRVMAQLGIDLITPPSRSRRVLCRPCLDWSERRPHLAGTLGAALCAHAFATGWIRRIENSRAVMVTPVGSRVLRESFGIGSH